MACADEECAKLAEEFERDLYSDELKRLQLTCGGKEIDERCVAVLKNASNLGFMEMMTSE